MAARYIVAALVLLIFSFMALGQEIKNSGQYPLVVSTWPFLQAVRAAWKVVDSGRSAVDAVVEGCSTCEELRCDGTGENMIPSTCDLNFESFGLSSSMFNSLF